jgi:predicted nuclease of predicted toxin-antitoxin system
MARISLYLDEDVRVLLAEVLRGRGYDVSHALEVGRGGKGDSEQFAYAVKHGRAILTHNIRDFIKLAKSYQELNKNHYGIVVSSHLPFQELLKRALKLLSSHSKDDLKNRFIWLNDYK